MKRKACRATRIVVLALGSIAAPLFAFGCGGGMPQPGREGLTAAPGNEDPAAALDRAERDVQLALGMYPAPVAQGTASQSYGGAAQQPSPQQAPFATPPPAPTATLPPPPSDPARKAESEAKHAEATAGADADATPVSADPCFTACRALHSMGRAATHLCDMAGEDNDRCASAKDRLRRAEELVRQRCPDCAS